MEEQIASSPSNRGENDATAEEQQQQQQQEEQRRRQRRLELTPEERDWALDIRDMIEMTPEVDHNLPDFWCAHLALAVKDDVADAVRRVIHLQEFREAYDIRDTPQQGRQLIQKYMELFPGQLLNLGLDTPQSLQGQEQGEGGLEQNEDLGTVVLVHDCSKFDSTLLDTDQKMRVFMGGAYYMHQALFIDCEAARRGVTVLAECENVSFTKKQNLKVLSRMFSELVTAYPTKGCTHHFRTGVLANIMTSLLRKFLPQDQRETFRAGCQSDGGSFDKLYLTPDIETASRRVLDSFTEFLERRYETEKLFTLTCPEEDEPIAFEELLEHRGDGEDYSQLQ